MFRVSRDFNLADVPAGISNSRDASAVNEAEGPCSLGFRNLVVTTSHRRVIDPHLADFTGG